MSRRSIHAHLLVAAGLLWGTLVSGGPGLAAPGGDPHSIDVYRSRPDGPKLFVFATLPDGKEGLFLVDTGADLSILSPSTARRLGLDQSRQTVRMSGLNHTTEVPLASLQGLTIAGHTLDEVRVAVGVPGIQDTFGDLPIDGLLGNNVWEHFVFDLNYATNTLTLRPPQASRIGRKSSPIHYDGGHVHTVVQFRSPTRDGVHTVRVAVDTGATGLILRGASGLGDEAGTTEGMETVLGLGSDPSNPGFGTLQRTRRLPLSSLHLGGRTLDVDFEARWLAFDQELGEDPLRVTGLLGYEALAHQRLVIDYRRRRLALKPARGADVHRSAHEAWLDLYASQPDRVDLTVFERAQLMTSTGRTREAVALLRTALSSLEASQARRARVSLAHLHRSLGEHAEALAVLSPLTPEQLLLHRELLPHIGALILADRRDEARQIAREAATAQRLHPDAWVALADAQLAFEHPEAAHEALLQAAEVSGNPDAFLLRRARVALASGDRNGALALLRRGVKLNPLDGKFLWFQASLAGPEDLPTVQADLDRILRRTHPSNRPLDFLAGTFSLLGETDKAMSLASEGLSRDCPKLDTDMARANCEAWYDALTASELPAAAERIQGALDASGPRGEYLDTDALIRFRQGDLERALHSATEAARMLPGDPYMMWQLDFLKARWKVATAQATVPERALEQVPE